MDKNAGHSSEAAALGGHYVRKFCPSGCGLEGEFECDLYITWCICLAGDEAE